MSARLDVWRCEREVYYALCNHYVNAAVQDDMVTISRLWVSRTASTAHRAVKGKAYAACMCACEKGSVRSILSISQCSVMSMMIPCGGSCMAASWEKSHRIGEGGSHLIIPSGQKYRTIFFDRLTVECIQYLTHNRLLVFSIDLFTYYRFSDCTHHILHIFCSLFGYALTHRTSFGCLLTWPDRIIAWSGNIGCRIRVGSSASEYIVSALNRSSHHKQTILSLMYVYVQPAERVPY